MVTDRFTIQRTRIGSPVSHFYCGLSDSAEALARFANYVEDAIWYDGAEQAARRLERLKASGRIKADDGYTYTVVPRRNRFL